MTETFTGKPARPSPSPPGPLSHRTPARPGEGEEQGRGRPSPGGREGDGRGDGGEGSGRGLLLLALLLAACAQPETIPLTPGAVHSRTLSGGRPHRFRFEAPAGQLLHLVVEQRGIDVVVLLKDPSGRLIFEVDNPTGRKEPETVLAVTPAAGEYTLVVEPYAAGKEGAFDLVVREARPAGREDRLRAAVAAAVARAERRRIENNPERAAPAWREALAGLEALGDGRETARAQWRLGQALRETGELAEAAAVLEEAAERFARLADPLGEARALNDLGLARRLLGEPGLALQAHERALGLQREAGNLPGVASSLNDLGLVLEGAGDLQGAIDRLEEARVLWRRQGDRESESTTLQNLGRLYNVIGHPEEATDLLRQALKLVEGGGEKERASALIEMGWSEHLAGRHAEALGFYEEALPLARRQGNRLPEAGAWDRQGTALAALRRFDEAAASYRRASEVCRETGSRRCQGHTLANLGWLELERGAAQEARRRLGEALDLLRLSGDPNGEIFVRVGLSRAERRLGALGPARRQAEEAVRLVEELRAGLQGPLSRGSFLATRFDAYEELAARLMDQGRTREALEVAERARARNLSEGLEPLTPLTPLSHHTPALPGEGGKPGRGRPSPGGREGDGRGDGGEGSRLRILRAELQALDARRHALAAENPRDPRLRDLDAELRKRSLELDRLAAASPRPAAFQPLTAAQIQSLAGDGSVFLVYLLSEPASFAWTVDRDGIEAHRLPDGERIERLARRVIAGFSQKSQVAAREAAARAARELSQAVLAPLRHRLGGHRRLVVLADGALHLVPFAALPIPGESRPLLADHEIVLLPSATFLDRQQRRLARRAPAPGALAVLADPVFSPEDERLAGSGSRTAGSRGRGFDPGPFQRLPYTAREAEALLRLVPRDQALVALGTEANRDLVTSGALARFRLVHFATHGLLHPVLPERSGIVLSQVDGKGRRRDGFLSAPDVAGLDLPAEMVVLSACRTGLGRELRGEGLVGLTHAFFRAGARRVVVSHWNVQDRATAELMARFYRGLLAEGLPPASALRAAQLSIRAEPKWSSPWFWAGFSLHGDWQ